MNFGWTEQQEAVREKVRSFLRTHLPSDWDEIASLSPGSEAVTNFSRRFCPELAQAGLLVPHWPAEFGGCDASSCGPIG
jgi:alkylation response protein AidB-like acyl-CoA dehydrogenase